MWLFQDWNWLLFNYSYYIPNFIYIYSSQNLLSVYLMSTVVQRESVRSFQSLFCRVYIEELTITLTFASGDWCCPLSKSISKICNVHFSFYLITGWAIIMILNEVMLCGKPSKCPDIVLHVTYFTKKEDKCRFLGALYIIIISNQIRQDLEWVLLLLLTSLVSLVLNEVLCGRTVLKVASFTKKRR